MPPPGTKDTVPQHSRSGLSGSQKAPVAFQELISGSDATAGGALDADVANPICGTYQPKYISRSPLVANKKL
jgi:hypothetical protein